MTDWCEPPTDEDRDVAPLLAKMERVEGLALRVVEDESGDPGFTLLAMIVGWIAVLQQRICAAERWNRRAARKKEMLGSEGLRMNMCDRLGGVGALERWERRARVALSFSSQAGDPAAAQRAHRRDDGKRDNHTTPTPSPRRMPGSPEGVREFALARLPGRGVRRVTKRTLRAAPRYETPIPVWPCEVMPERFAREWWRDNPSKQTKAECNTDAFPEYRKAKYPGSREGRPESYGSKARDPAAAQRDASPGMRVDGNYDPKTGGPASHAGTIARAA